MTLPKRFEAVRQQCAHFPDFCPRNALEGSEFCEQHQPRPVAVEEPHGPDLERTAIRDSLREKYGTAPEVPPGAIASPEAYKLALELDPDLAAVLGEDDLDDAVAPLLGRRRRPHVHIKPEPPRRALLPFEPVAGTRWLQAQPMKPFKPRGLMLWNPGELQVEAHTIGNNNELLCSWGKVPALWWSTQRSFEEVCKALEEGKEAASWGDWSTAYPGVYIRLQFDGDCSNVRALMWGHTL